MKILLLTISLTLFIVIGYSQTILSNSWNSEPLNIEINNDGVDTYKIIPKINEYYVIDRVSTGSPNNHEATSNLLYTKKSGHESTFYIDVNTVVKIQILPGDFFILNNLKFSDGNKVFYYTGTRYYRN